MAKYLMINGFTGALRLPADTDLEELRTRLVEAANGREVVTVLGELQDNPLVPVPMHVLPSNLNWWSVVETSEADTR